MERVAPGATDLEHAGSMHGHSQNRRSAGRPTREQAEARFEELLDTSLDLFLKNGFELTTIEMIGAAMNMTKRTVYAKFEDKASLFLAAVDRAIERHVVPLDTLRALDRGDLVETLEEIARLRIGQYMTPEGLRLQRIIQAESYRFPQIFEWNYEKSAWPLMSFIVELLERAMEAGTIARVDAVQAASAFMSMVVGGQVRTIVGGRKPSRAEVDEKVKFTVGLLLNGLLPRGT